MQSSINQGSEENLGKAGSCSSPGPALATSCAFAAGSWLFHQHKSSTAVFHDLLYISLITIKKQAPLGAEIAAESLLKAVKADRIWLQAVGWGSHTYLHGNSTWMYLLGGATPSARALRAMMREMESAQTTFRSMALARGEVLLSLELAGFMRSSCLRSEVW